MPDPDSLPESTRIENLEHRVNAITGTNIPTLRNRVADLELRVERNSVDTHVPQIDRVMAELARLVKKWGEHDGDFKEAARKLQHIIYDFEPPPDAAESARLIAAALKSPDTNIADLAGYWARALSRVADDIRASSITDALNAASTPQTEPAEPQDSARENSVEGEPRETEIDLIEISDQPDGTAHLYFKIHGRDVTILNACPVRVSQGDDHGDDNDDPVTTAVTIHAKDWGGDFSIGCIRGFSVRRNGPVVINFDRKNLPPGNGIERLGEWATAFLNRQGKIDADRRELKRLKTFRKDIVDWFDCVSPMPGCSHADDSDLALSVRRHAMRVENRATTAQIDAEARVEESLVKLNGLEAFRRDVVEWLDHVAPHHDGNSHADDLDLAASTRAYVAGVECRVSHHERRGDVFNDKLNATRAKLCIANAKIRGFKRKTVARLVLDLLAPDAAGSVVILRYGATRLTLIDAFAESFSMGGMTIVAKRHHGPLSLVAATVDSGVVRVTLDVANLTGVDGLDELIDWASTSSGKLADSPHSAPWRFLNSLNVYELDAFGSDHGVERRPGQRDYGYCEAIRRGVDFRDPKVIADVKRLSQVSS